MAGYEVLVRDQGNDLFVEPRTSSVMVGDILFINNKELGKLNGGCCFVLKLESILTIGRGDPTQ
jgi:hypothetical protein